MVFDDFLLYKEKIFDKKKKHENKRSPRKTLNSDSAFILQIQNAFYSRTVFIKTIG